MVCGEAPGLRILAPAKINLYLHVLGRRDDGYHLLESLVVFAAVHDVVTVRPNAELTLAIDGPFAAALATGDENLVMRAARALAAAAGARDGAAITLTKTLPVAAGLGGGSSDAAAALKALAGLWQVSLPAGSLYSIAEGLGADVPVCLHGTTALVRGIGEVIEPGPALPVMGVVLVNPGIMVSTAEVFRDRDAPFSGPGGFTVAPDDAAAVAAGLAALRNDLTGAACAAAPGIVPVLAALDRDPACLLSRLSGSGPTCFGLYADEAAARAAAARLGAANPGWWVCPSRAPVSAGSPQPVR